MKANDYFFTVGIDGTDYPAALTNGALVTFGEITGHDFGAPSATATLDNIAIIYACVKSGCRRRGVDFPLTMMEMADLTTPADLATFASALRRVTSPASEPSEGEDSKESKGSGGEKKSRRS